MLAIVLLCIYAFLATVNGSVLDIPSTKLTKPNQSTKDVKQQRDLVDKSPAKSRQEKEQLFEAYNLLHTLAQDFHKPFDSPAVIVVGHQTSGKSALIEALMGFQFNQVGGGTKTRRPVALRMQYNPSCTTPMCFLTLENGKEERRSLADIQAYIESENKRLERDPTRSFDSREINIRMEYRFCPNMIVIDTPGMLHPPKGRHLTPQQRALAQAAREAESLVLNKIKCQDYIILCVEDTTDWKHATTRNVVMQADPDLSRTVLVTTKLDTKIPQFSEPDDLEDFLNAPLVHKLFPRILGGPFFTSVPAGRVGVSKDFVTNEMFVSALRGAEHKDADEIGRLMGSGSARGPLKRVGVNQLRSFLESRVEDCYRRNVAKIVPLLQHELRLSEAKLTQVEEELNSLSIDRLRNAANIYREKFSKELSETIHGTVRASPDEWGETLEAEQLRGGSFMEQDQVRSAMWQRVLEVEVGHNKHKLFGGAQYHRALREFTVAVRHMRSPQVSEDEIANAAGLGEVHDGVNFMRAACVIAIEKAQTVFEPMLEALRHRSVHIMRRLFPIVEHMAAKNGGGLPADVYNRPLQDMIRRVYDKFVDQQMEVCLGKCRDDLKGMTRFVTWDSDGRGGSSVLYKHLPTPKRMSQIYTAVVEQKQRPAELKVSSEQYDRNNRRGNDNKDSKGKNDKQSKGWGKLGNKDNKNGKNDNTADRVFSDWNQANGDSDSSDLTVADSSSAESTAVTSSTNGLWEEEAQLSDYYNLLQLMEEMLAGRNANRTNTVVTAIVQHIIKTWTEHFARTVSMKFNCFFLMPFLDNFPSYLRSELDKLYDSDVDDMFDIAEARAGLQQQRRDLQAECDANSKLQRRFDTISSQLRAAATNGASSAETVSTGIDVDTSSRSDVSNNFEFNSGGNSQEEMDNSNDSQYGWQVEDTASSISAVADGLDSKENI